MEVAQGGREGGRGRSYGAPRTDQPNQGAELSYSCSVESGALAQLNQIEPVDRRCFRRAVWAHTSSTTPVRYGGSDRHRTRDEVAGHHHLPSRTLTTATNQAASLVSATLHSTPLRAGDAQAKKMRRPSCRPGVGLRGWPHCRGTQRTLTHPVRFIAQGILELSDWGRTQET